MVIVALLATAALAFRFWLRVDGLRADIAALRLRVEALEAKPAKK